MSGSIFGDDDDFELVGGSDTPSAIRKPPAATPAVRPVAPRTPSIPAQNSGASKNTSTRTIPAVATAPSALPRPSLPLPTNNVPPRRALPDKQPEPVKITDAPKQERVEAPKPPVSPTREIPARDTTRPRTEQATEPRRVPAAVAPVNEPESFEKPYVEERPAVLPTNSYVERESSVPNTVQDSRRSIRSNSNDHYDDVLSNDDDTDDRFSDRRYSNSHPQEEFTSPKVYEESPRSLYSQKPYTPRETPSPAPARAEQHRVEQPVRSYPEAETAPVVKRPQQDAQPESKTKAARFAKPKKSKVDKEEKAKGPSNFSGGRAGVVVVRVFAIIIVAILMIAGGKSIFFPSTIPDPTTITNVVKKRLGVTNFPAEGGQAFVTSFAKLYLTIDPASPNSSDVYAPYMSSSVASNMTSSNGAVKQAVTEGPIISGVKSVDDSNAIYTVAAKLDSGKNWIYLDIPVYYDKDSVGFAISGTPAFAPAPTKITAPAAGSPFEQDGKLADSIRSSVMEQFFPAWAASNSNGINLVVLANANSEAKIGLDNAVKFGAIQSFTVEIKQPGDADENTRKAQATVRWVSPADAKITYTQQYNFVLFRQPDNRWYIKEMTSGVRS